MVILKEEKIMKNLQHETRVQQLNQSIAFQIFF